VRKKQPCTVCRNWYQPDPRVGRRSKTCGREECQRKRRVQTNQAWRLSHPEYDAERRLNARLVSAVDAEKNGRSPAGRSPGVPWDVVQAEIGLKPSVIAEEYLRVARRAAQAEMRGYVSDLKEEIARHGRSNRQAETAMVP
jgi:hypothetical protein